MNEHNYEKQPVVKATYAVLKLIHLLKIANTFGLLWNIYPAADLVKRNHHA